MKTRKIIIFLCIFILTNNVFAASHPAGGIVFADKNQDGKKDVDEAGISDVIITDGISVTKTDTNGFFQIKAESDCLYPPGIKPIISMSVPDNMRANGEWFARMTGNPEKDSQMEFALTPAVQKIPFSFIHVTDIHFPAMPKVFYQSFVGEINNDDYKFVVNSGDICSTLDSVNKTDALKQINGFLENVVKPQKTHSWIVPGNHEIAGVNFNSITNDWNADDPDYAYGLFLKKIGPLRFSFNYAGYLFIGLDVMDKKNNEWNRSLDLSFPKHTLVWLEKILASTGKRKPVIIFGHYFSHNNEFIKILKEYNVKLLLVGHLHTEGKKDYAGIPMVFSGSLGTIWGDRMLGYNVVNVSDQAINTLYRTAGKSQGININSPRFFHKAEMKYYNHLEGLIPLEGNIYGIDKTQEAFAEIGGNRIPLSIIPGRLYDSFSGSLDAKKLVEGYYKLKITARGENGAVTCDRNLFLITGGENPVIKCSATPFLYVRAAGIDKPLKIVFNGKTIDCINKTSKGGDRFNISGVYDVYDEDKGDLVLQKEAIQEFKYELDRESIVKINRITFFPAPDDRIALVRVWMEYNGKKYYDMSKPHYYGDIVDNKALTKFIDITDNEKASPDEWHMGHYWGEKIKEDEK